MTERLPPATEYRGHPPRVFSPGLGRPGAVTERLDRYWRICATGLCFSGFGIGGLCLRLIAFPLLRLAVWPQPRRTAVARWLVHASMRSFVWLMRTLGVLSYDVRGAEKLRRGGLLVLANHPSLIDVVFLISLVRRPDCVVKAPLLRNAFTRGPVRMAGFICNDSGAGLVDDAIASLRAGNNLIIFPEGTRTPLSGELRLQRGAANVAVRGGIDITPVVIRCRPPTLTKGEKWYHVPYRRAHFDIVVGDDIAVRPFLDNPAGDALAARRLTDTLAEYFALELARADA
jgi:1-acyl-sn-glycerol-3-phosphate acyltransferase